MAATASAATSRPEPTTDSAGAPWWAYSAFFMGAQTIFGIYVAIVVLLDFHNPEAGPYLSPFFSPLLPAATIGSFLLSPGIFIVWSPLGFRASCYYYRKSYFRALMAPPNCSISPPGPLQKLRYHGERAFPWVFNNLHRFFLYTAIINVAFLLYDVIHSLSHHGQVYIGLGTFVLALNVVMLSLYTFGCHAFRHLVGGSLDCYSCTWSQRARRSIWEKVTALNERHGFWALFSLFTVWGADVYVRLLAHGVISDIHVAF